MDVLNYLRRAEITLKRWQRLRILAPRGIGSADDVSACYLKGSEVKLAISGKGGVGKTTLSAMLTAGLALEGYHVIALDADPDANLGSALGLSDEEGVTPLAEMRDLIKERTGAANAYGGYFKLNPKVDDIPEAYARVIGNVRLLTLGGISGGGDGCICPASALLKALLMHLVLGRDDHVIMDMEAGIEHLGRATAQSMDALIVVVNPAAWSIQTAQRVRALAGDIKLARVFAVANRITDDDQLDRIQEQLGDMPLIGHLPVDNRLVDGIIRITPDGEMTPSAALDDHLTSLKALRKALEDRL